MARTKPWKVSDEFWEKVEPSIPPPPMPKAAGPAWTTAMPSPP
jgi:hypothetical protein